MALPLPPLTNVSGMSTVFGPPVDMYAAPLIVPLVPPPPPAALPRPPTDAKALLMEPLRPWKDATLVYFVKTTEKQNKTFHSHILCRCVPIYPGRNWNIHKHTDPRQLFIYTNLTYILKNRNKNSRTENPLIF